MCQPVVGKSSHGFAIAAFIAVTSMSKHQQAKENRHEKKYRYP